MICIVMGHLGIGRINSFVFTFHVPIFFLISGYFLSDKLTTREYIKRKGKQLIIPYIITCIFIIGGTTIRGIIQTRSLENVVENVKTWTLASIYGSGTIEYSSPFYMKQIGATWFFLALFLALIIVRFFITEKYAFCWIIIIAYCGYKMTDILWLPFSIQAGMTASLFVYIGWLSKKKKLFEKAVPFPILSGMICIWLFCIIFGGQLYLVRNYFGNGLLDIIGALCGSYLVILFAKKIEENTSWLSLILEFYGKNTLLMLCCHAFELKVISWEWVWKFFGDQLKLQNFSVVCILIILKLLFCTLGIYLIKYIQRIYKSIILKFSQKEQIQKTFINKSVESDRVKYWDVAKGITIILMILGHVSIPEYLRRIIFSFHMPLFIIANGYFIKSYDIKRTFTRSIKSLLYPYCITCIISAVIFAVIGNNGNFCMPLFMHKIKAMLGGMSKISTKFQGFDSVCVVWFVCSLFITRNLYVVLMNIVGKYSKTIIIGTVALVTFLGYILGQYYAFLPWSFDVALVSVPFIMFGDWLRKKQIIEKNYFWTLILPGAIWVYFLKMGIHIELATRYYPCGIFSFIEAIAGSLVVISVSKMITKWKGGVKLISWIGKNSILILAIHCLELLYMNWGEWIFKYLPFSMNWFRIFVLKSILIIVTAALVSLLKNWISKGISTIRVKA